ncbi:vitamin K epoxide reductase family protein [Candidatus Nomurabacteria bacterium]|nr:vitamin K epoxide reductase family protein [Candidatus Nomurabacteria bacterium]
MTFSEDVLLRVAIFVLGACGFWVAKHIREHKVEQKPLVCPIQFDCNTVVHSDYSKFLGMPVEILGMVYYALVSLSYLFFIFLPNVLPNIVIGGMIVLSLVAFLFSLYLIGVQVFALKKGCSWCFVSAFISISIFVLTLLTYDFGSVAENIIH